MSRFGDLGKEGITHVFTFQYVSRRRFFNGIGGAGAPRALFRLSEQKRAFCTLARLQQHARLVCIGGQNFRLGTVNGTAYQFHAMIHNVYFWLKPDLTPEQISTFETELMHLLEIDYLEHGFAGRPAPTEARPVTDHSFSYSLVLHFKSLKDHEFYQKDCLKHKRFVDTCKPFFDRVIVYDTSPLH